MLDQKSFHCKHVCQDPARCSKRHEKQTSISRLQDILQRQVDLGRKILDTNWNPTEDMKREYAALFAEHDSARKECEAASVECNGPVYVHQVR
jgi:hypothetical protein